MAKVKDEACYLSNTLNKLLRNFPLFLRYNRSISKHRRFYDFFQTSERTAY